MKRSLLSFIPKSFLSQMFGKFADCSFPKFFQVIVNRVYCWLFSVDLSQASLDTADQYASLTALFIRELRLGTRTFEGVVCSPVDGRLRDVVSLNSDQVLLAKAQYYSISELIDDQQLYSELEGGLAWHLYLSPSDYHRFHLPIDCSLKAVTHISGHVWPVNDWAHKNVPNLYLENERVICSFQSEYGPVVMVMIAAFNVGKIFLKRGAMFSSFGSHSNVPNQESSGADCRHQTDWRQGEQLGYFALGSSVILMVGEKFKSQFKSQYQVGSPNEQIWLGQPFMCER